MTETRKGEKGFTGNGKLPSNTGYKAKKAIPYESKIPIHASM
jgi:hypothetical protein